MLDSLLEIGMKDIVDVGVVIGVKDVVDVGVVGLLLWALIAWTRRVHASLALLGLGILGGFYLIALQLELQLTAWFFQGFFAVVVILLVVVFQDDLRRLFEQIAVLGLRRRPARTRTDGLAILAGALLHLARTRTGALLVLPGREPLERHLQGGTALDAVISEELLLSIFDPSSPGHDGAILVQGDRIVRFAVHLPLTEDHARLGPGGTRHAAALGLAERCDALCVVVSEERGTVAVARRGRLQVLEDPEHLQGAMRQHLARLGPQSGRRRRAQRQQVRRRGLEGLAAFVLALAGWVVFVPGSTVGQLTYIVPVVVENMPQGYALEGVEPEVVEVTVKGPRRALLLAQVADFQLIVGDTSLVKLRRRTFAISREAVRHPAGLKVVEVRPPKVRLLVRQIR